MEIRKPGRLRRGDVIGLIAPGSAPQDPGRLESGIRYLEGCGYRVRVGRHVLAQHGYLAGTDAQRVDDLNAMLRDPQVRAIFAVRGGYGTPRLLPHVDYAAARRDPKILVGYSDLTALQLALFRRAGWVTFAGPMVAVDLGRKLDAYTESHFWRVLTSTARVGRMPQPEGHPLGLRHPGRIEGRLLGTNLSLLVSTLGTPYSPDYRGAVLVLEDVHEHLHRLDRMFTQLRNAGVLNRIGGLVLGRFTQCGPSDPHQPHLKPSALMTEILQWLSHPTVERFAFGHVPVKLTLPLGCWAQLDADRGRLTILESAVV